MCQNKNIAWDHHELIFKRRLLVPLCQTPGQIFQLGYNSFLQEIKKKKKREKDRAYLMNFMVGMLYGECYLSSGIHPVLLSIKF